MRQARQGGAKSKDSDQRTGRPLTRKAAATLDRDDPLKRVRSRFVLPDGLLYLDGNSLGAMPKVAAKRLARTTAEWSDGLIRSWNEAGWFKLTLGVGERIGRLIGAPPGSVVAGDTISVNLFKVLAAALELRPDRRVILTDSGNFPSDIYVAEGLARLLGRGHAVKIVEPEAVAGAIDDSVAVLMLTEVDYRTGRLHDMVALTRKAHRAGVVTVWDLAHSAGVLPVDLTGSRADFAHGCTYKYLNGGPGAPAFLYVRPDLQAKVRSPLQGWWGHRAPFDFDLAYAPADGIGRMQCGTQPILSLAVLDAALEVWEDVDLLVVRDKSEALTGLFMDVVEDRCAGMGLVLAGPREPDRRGSQVSYRHPEGYAVMQALVADGVIGDFRAPDMIRFGFAPLYIRHVDAWDAADRLARVLAERRWDQPRFRQRQAVT